MNQKEFKTMSKEEQQYLMVDTMNTMIDVIQQLRTDIDDLQDENEVMRWYINTLVELVMSNKENINGINEYVDALQNHGISLDSYENEGVLNG